MIKKPPVVSRGTAFFAALLERISRLSTQAAWLITVASLLAIIAADLATSQIVSMIMPYLVLTLFAAWRLGERVGVGVALAAIVATTFVNVLAKPALAGITTAATIWNLSGRGIVLVLAAVIAHALHVTLLMERWRASTDMLTGALNKAAFNAAMAERIVAARRRKEALVLGYLDLDGFKGVNDGHGHSAGDRVLRAFSDGVAGSIRQTDIFARIGGDEFVVLLTVPEVGAGDVAAEVLHSRLTRILRETGFDVTCSMGAIVLDSHQISEGDSCLELADHLMYEVKRTGKNALRIARGDLLGDTLRTAFPPQEMDDLELLLTRIDNADRALARRAAA